MAQLYHTNRFTRGEVEPALFDRVDVDFYQAACRRMLNWLPLPAGAAKRRAALTRGPSITLVEGQTLCDTFLGAFSFDEQDYFVLFLLVDDGGSKEVQLRVYSDDLELVEDLGAIAAVGGDCYMLASEICTASVGPSMFITSRRFPPHRLFMNLSTGGFESEPITFYEELIGQLTLENGSSNVTGEDTLFEEQLSPNDVIRIEGETQTYTISSITDNSAMSFTANYTGLNKEARFFKVAASPFGEGQNPALCTFYHGRLLLFSTEARPVTMWASRAQDPYTVLPGSVYDDAPIVYDLLADSGDRFLWVHATDRVFLGSRKIEGAIFSDSGTTFTAATFQFAKVASLGGAAAKPFETESNVVFLAAGRNQLFSVQFDLARQGFITRNLSSLSPHLLREGVVAMAYRPSVNLDFTPRVFAQKEDGSIAVCTLFEEEQVLGWSRMEAPLGFQFRAVATSPEEVATVVFDENTGTYFLSIMDFDVEQGYLLDFSTSAAVSDGVATVTDPILGGRQVVVLDPSLGNLGFHDVTDGQIDLTTFENLSGEVIIGLTASDEIQLLPVVVQLPGRGLSLNQKRRVTRVMVSVNDTRQLLVEGREVVPVQQIAEGLSPQTGVFTIWSLGWTSQDSLRIQGASVYPARILSITREVST